MTIEALKEAIKRLIIARQKAHGNAEEQNKLNEKLTKLYDIKYIALQQEAKKNN